GWLLLRADRRQAEEAEALFHRALEIARNQEARFQELYAAMCLARLRRSQGKPAEGRAVLEPVYRSFTEGFDTADLKDAKALLEELSYPGFEIALPELHGRESRERQILSGVRRSARTSLRRLRR